MRAREDRATLASAPVGILFAIGVLAGLVIGTINCYQLLYNEVGDHLPQYATLKAMGFSDTFLRHLILEQSVVLAAAGFAAGLVLAICADALIAWETRLPVRVDNGSGLLVCLMTLGMCILAGWLAIRRVAAADPAALY